MADRDKFRVWCVCHNEWEKDDLLLHPLGMFFENNKPSIHNTDKHIIEHCTGLRDMNNKLVYEGDVVKKNNKIYKIIWNDEFAGFFLAKLTQDDQSMSSVILLSLDDCEIIGNIHENKELLEK